MKQNVKILAIETSCDETAVAIIGVENNRPVILSNVISSQIDLHAKTGGVVPEVAARAHIESIIPVVQEALARANHKSQIANNKQTPNSKIQKSILTIQQYNNELLSTITHIAVTVGPGLIGSLLVGFNTAKAMAYALDVPIMPINHIEGHIYSALAEQFPISNFQFPILALTVSGGHTSLTLMKDHGVYETIGQTRDDAAGEAFDKVAKLLNLGYPGGHVVSKLAEEYRKKISNSKFLISNEISNNKKSDKANEAIVLPRPMIKDKNFDFSFSGLKTAVLDVVKNLETKELKNRKQEICAAFEDAAVDVLVAKTLRAAVKYQSKAVILAGGVAANKRLRKELALRLSQNPNIKIQITNKYQIPKSKKAESYKLEARSLSLLIPPINLCGDNAAMIGMAAYYHIMRGDTKNWNHIKVDSNLAL